MVRRRLLVGIGLALTVGAVTWALAGLPGDPAPCLPTDCDCEAPGPGRIRQPANAWSSLALIVTGVLVAIASPGGDAPAGRRGGGQQARWFAPFCPPPSNLPASLVRALSASPQPPPGRGGREGESGPPGGPGRFLEPTRTIAAGALVAAGLGAFLYHAGLTAWASRLDGILVAVLVGALALHACTRIAGKAGQRRASRGMPWRRLAPWPLLALGATAWWLGQSGGPWCRPDSLGQAHAAWHVLAAAGIGPWLGSGRSSPQPPAPSSLRSAGASRP